VTATRGAPQTVVPPDREISVFELLAPLVRRRRLILAFAVVGGVLAMIVLLLQRPVYTGKTSFTPENSSSTSLASSLAGLAGLANLAGVGGTSASSSVSPDFFAEVIHSREILRSTLELPFPAPTPAGGSVTQPLYQILRMKGKTTEERLQNGVRELEKRTEVGIDRRTGIVSLAVEMPSRELSASVANRIVELLNRFNLERRQFQSREERRFSGDRLATAERELRQAEQAQLTFLQRNRVYAESPLLSFEATRLSREVQLKQEVFLTLTKSYEQARINEVRDTPVLTVIDSAIPPVRRTRPRRAVGTIIATLIAGLVGVAAAYAVDYRARARSATSGGGNRQREGWPEPLQQVGVKPKDI
jgi:uncharacterized protein involved in exopolysaccharide biosynthesis